MSHISIPDEIYYAVKDISNDLGYNIWKESMTIPQLCVLSLVLYKDKWEALSRVYGPSEWIYWRNFYDNAITKEYLDAGMKHCIEEYGDNCNDYNEIRDILDVVNSIEDDEKDEKDSVSQRIKKYIMREF